MTNDYTQPVYYSQCLGRLTEVEWALETICSTPDTGFRYRLLLELHQHLVDYECPQLRRVLSSLNLQYGHKRYEKPPTLPCIPQPGVELPNKIFHSKIHDNIHNEDVSIDMRLLQQWIKINFLDPLLKYKYSWFALWKFFMDKRILKNELISDFCEQMDTWFYNPTDQSSLKPNKSSVWRYNGYLSETPYLEWNEQTFENNKRENQRLDGFKHLKSVCYVLAGKWNVRLLKQKYDKESNA